MNKLDIDSFEFCKKGIPRLSKGPVILGYKGSEAWPLCYLRKPKDLSDKQWQEFLNRIDFNIYSRVPE